MALDMEYVPKMPPGVVAYLVHEASRNMRKPRAVIARVSGVFAFSPFYRHFPAMSRPRCALIIVNRVHLYVL